MTSPSPSRAIAIRCRCTRGLCVHRSGIREAGGCFGRGSAGKSRGSVCGWKVESRSGCDGSRRGGSRRGSSWWGGDRNGRSSAGFYAGIDAGSGRIQRHSSALKPFRRPPAEKWGSCPFECACVRACMATHARALGGNLTSM